MTSAAIDGEVVALDDKGMPSFSKLQNAIKSGGQLMFFAFDLLELDGTDLTHLPLLDRKAKLKSLVAAVGEPLLYSDHIHGDGEPVLSTICTFGGVGIISKRADGKYNGKRIDHLELPDRPVIDLDPDPSVDFAEVKRAAREVEARLAERGLASSWPMVTGGKGLHVVAPLTPSHDWEAVKAFSKSFAEAMAGDRPDRFTSKMSKAGRAGRIFVDYLRNQRGAAASAPFSTRAPAHRSLCRWAGAS